METQIGRSQRAGKFSGQSLTMLRILLITVVVQCLFVLRVEAVTLPFEKDAEPFYSPKFQVVWAATNSLPATVKIYRVVPVGFSPAAISNLTAMGGSADLKQGAMNLYQPADGRSPLEKVPDKARAYELGTNLLARLEIPVDQLMSQGGRPMALYSPDARSHRDKATHKVITEPCAMGVEFRRMLDGIECFGQQVRFQFESREKLSQLNVKWCGLQSVQSCRIASADQIVTWIKEGRARAQSVETTGQRWIKVADIKKVIIRNVGICYDANPDWETPEKLPTILCPYANILVEVEFSQDDREMIGLFCPVIKEALSPAIPKSSEFNIFPSTLYEKREKSEGGK